MFGSACNHLSSSAIAFEVTLARPCILSCIDQPRNRCSELLRGLRGQRAAWLSVHPHLTVAAARCTRLLGANSRLQPARAVAKAAAAAAMVARACSTSTVATSLAQRSRERLRSACWRTWTTKQPASDSPGIGPHCRQCSTLLKA